MKNIGNDIIHTRDRYMEELWREKGEGEIAMTT